MRETRPGNGTDQSLHPCAIIIYSLGGMFFSFLYVRILSHPLKAAFLLQQRPCHPRANIPRMLLRSLWALDDYCQLLAEAEPGLHI